MTTSLRKSGEGSCVFQVVRVSGTIKKAEEEGIRRARVAMRRARIEKGEDGGLERFVGGDVEDELGEEVESEDEEVDSVHDGG